MHWIRFDFPSGPTLKVKIGDAPGHNQCALSLSLSSKLETKIVAPPVIPSSVPIT